MDLGLAGRVALVTGASKGIGFGIASGLVARARRSPWRRATPGGSRRRPRGSARVPIVFDSDDLDAVDGVVDAVERELGPDRRLRGEHGRAAHGRRPARLQPRGVGGGAPHARPLADGLHRAPAARRCASAAGGAIVGVSSLSRARAAAEHPALQRAPPGSGRGVQGPGQAVGGGRRHAQHTCCRGGSGPTGSSATQARARRPRPPRATRCPPAASGPWRRSPPRPCSCAPRRRRTSPGTTLLVDGGLTASV